MKKLILNRKNDFVSSLQAIHVKVNDNDYKLYSGTQLEIDIENEDVKVEVKYLFFWRKFIYKTDAKKLTVTIAPTISNHLLIISMLLLLTLFIIYTTTKLDVMNYLFKIYGVTILAMFFFITTVGGKYFYKANLS